MSHPVLNGAYYLGCEVLPMALVMYILRKLPPKVRDDGRRMVGAVHGPTGCTCAGELAMTGDGRVLGTRRTSSRRAMQAGIIPWTDRCCNDAMNPTWSTRHFPRRVSRVPEQLHNSKLQHEAERSHVHGGIAGGNASRAGLHPGGAAETSIVARAPARNSFLGPQKTPWPRYLVRIAPHAGQWLENSAQIDVPTPIETAWELWEDRERIPQWMPWITSVVIQDGDASLSKWTLSTHQFNRDWEFSWLAKNMTPLKYQKIHWRSVPGSVSGSLGGGLEIQNQGQIRFSRKNDGSCAVKLTISYEVPGALAPFANLLTPVVEGILQADMVRFRDYAVETMATDQDG